MQLHSVDPHPVSAKPHESCRTLRELSLVAGVEQVGTAVVAWEGRPAVTAVPRGHRAECRGEQGLGLWWMTRPLLGEPVSAPGGLALLALPRCVGRVRLGSCHFQ